jgi:proline iminopeptidase
MQAQVNGTELFYETVGSGPPMLVMHGGLGLDHSYFRPWMDQLGDTVQVIYYDHRGNGRSAWPSDWTGISHATWAADADALRAHLGHDKIILYGHSYGGFLAMEYAVRYADHLRGLILSCTAPALDYPEVIIGNAQARGSQETVDALVSGLANPSDNSEDFRALMTQIMPFYFANYDPSVGAAIDEKSIYSGPAYAHSFSQCVPVYNMNGKLAAIDVPTLVLSGADDWITPPAQGGERIAAEIPNADLVVFKESGHFPFIEEEARFMSVMRDWLKRVTGD